MNVMLLAAGEGTRLRPHTLIKPKPAIPFLNLPLATYPIALLEGVKIDRLVVNTFHLPTLIVDLFIQMHHGARKLHFSHEIHQLLGSGGGLSQARDYFLGQGDFIMMNADEVILPAQEKVLAKALTLHQQNKAICTLLTMDHPEAGGKFGGVWLNDLDEVRGFGKTKPTADSKKAEHFVGVQILSEKILDYIPHGVASNILYDAVTLALNDGHCVQRCKIDCHWYETGNTADFVAATSACLDLLKEDHSASAKYLQKVLRKYSKETPVLDFSDNQKILRAPGVELPPGVVSGFGVFAKGCRIPIDCHLKNMIIGERVHVAAKSHLQNNLLLEDN